MRIRRHDHAAEEAWLEKLQEDTSLEGVLPGPWLLGLRHHGLSGDSEEQVTDHSGAFPIQECRQSRSRLPGLAIPWVEGTTAVLTPLRPPTNRHGPVCAPESGDDADGGGGRPSPALFQDPHGQAFLENFPFTLASGNEIQSCN